MPAAITSPRPGVIDRWPGRDDSSPRRDRDLHPTEPDMTQLPTLSADPMRLGRGLRTSIGLLALVLVAVPAAAAPPAPPAAPAPSDTGTKIAEPIASFTGLDKITGRIISFDVAIDETVQFGALQVTPRVCYTRPQTSAPQTTSFVEVDEITLDNKIRRIFDGWMFAASPGLHAVEHPVYDVWLTDCKARSADPAVNAKATVDTGGAAKAAAPADAPASAIAPAAAKPAPAAAKPAAPSSLPTRSELPPLR